MLVRCGRELHQCCAKNRCPIDATTASADTATALCADRLSLSKKIFLYLQLYQQNRYIGALRHQFRDPATMHDASVFPFRRLYSVFIAMALLALSSPPVAAQVDEDELGAWYIYVWGARNEGSRFGFQGDIQHRNWDRGGDLEQLLIRGAVTYQREDSRARYAFGLAHITSGAYGDSNAKSREKRAYQELVLPGRLGERIYLTHRFRFEQRWVDNQDFRLRLRYLFGLDFPLNRTTMDPGAVYLSLYNELFVNVNESIGDGRRVDHFDRNRLYLALGRAFEDNRRLQIGYMHQQTDNIGKGQLQFTFLQQF